ncbi:MAG TPA: helix-turn-helix domain-containing protein [Thermoanaerobaculia bacterium]|nr:helix-turn-helix domain-containing protein [Thermoanaerobaculia bacterium]
MAESEGQRDTGDEKLYTLSDISHKTGISMPTLQRYKKLYQGRIPSVGSGRKQRYPDSALPVFDEIRNENIGRRGRPRKDASAKSPARRGPGRPAGSGRKANAAGRKGVRAGRVGRPAAKSAAAPAKARRGRPPGRRGSRTAGNLLTLTQISETTGISYPTLVRYVRLHSDRLPHEGKGRARRFYPQAVEVFRTLRQESGRGGRKPGRPAGGGRGRTALGSADASALAQRIKALEKSQQEIEKRFRGIAQTLQKLFR